MSKVAIFIPMPMALPSPGPIFAGLIQVVMNAAQDGHEYLACKRANQLDNARTIAAERAIENGATHILYLDADHIHPPDIVRDLLTHDVDVVGGLNYTRARRPAALAVDQKPLEKNTGLIECLAVGTGSLLVKCSVFERLQWPWFYYDYRNAKPGGMFEGEDTGFCRRCEEAGIKLWCDTETTSPHLDTDAWIA
jgi:hypothetical protein